MKKTIKDFDLENKRVIIRCDLNVPMKDGIKHGFNNLRYRNPTHWNSYKRH